MDEKTKSIIEDVLRLIGSRRPARRDPMIYGPALAYAELSYSLDGEDVFLRRRFKRRREPGFYVDIGCGDPYMISNTYALYCIGWRGLCIDPHTKFTNRWASERAGDILVHAAVGEATGEVFFHEHPGNFGQSLISADAAQKPGYVEAVKVPMRRLDDLFAENVGEHDIQFMNIDVEGAELGVLRSNDWSKWRPELIMVEVHDFDMAHPLESPPIAFLIERKYRLAGLIATNVVLARSD